MKKLILFVTLILVACTTPATPIIKSTISAVPQQVATVTQRALPTETLTSTSVPPAPTVVDQSTATPQPPATCPAVSKKAKLPLNPVFKDKKAPYHDARDVVLNFLNQGGDPQAAIEKLKEFNIYANAWDLTNDGVPEFILPSGYWTVFGCLDGKYESLLDESPSERNLTAVPLAIEDVNQNGMLELLIGQVRKQDMTTYKVYEWDGTRFSSLLPDDFKETGNNVYIQNHTIYAIGQSNADKGAFEGNWEIKTVGEGPKRILIRAGVFDNSIASSDLEQSLVLKWKDNSYIVGKLVTENTPTPLPTSTQIPFSATCSNRAPELHFQKPNTRANPEKDVLEYLNTGGTPEQLKHSYSTTIEDLNNDGAPEIILIEPNDFEPRIMMFTCRNGKYYRAIDFPNDIATFQLSIMTIKDNNKNGLPEVFVKDMGCLNLRCGALYVVEWDGDHFADKISEPDSLGGTLNYTMMNEPSNAYLKDMDDDGISELIWTGDIAPEWHADHWLSYPQRLGTHILKWDGKNYLAETVEYSKPHYRFQAVQDGDSYARDGKYEKALSSYELAIKDDGLDWWTELRGYYIMAQHKVGPCVNQEGVFTCGFPTEDPKEHPILSAYASFRTMVVYLLINDIEKAESTYQNLKATYTPDTPAYPITGMATAFWKEYQDSHEISSACAASIAYAGMNRDILTVLSGSRNGQGILYEENPSEVCPIK